MVVVLKTTEVNSLPEFESLTFLREINSVVRVSDLHSDGPQFESVISHSIIKSKHHWDVAQRQCEKLLTSRLLVRIQSSQLEFIPPFIADECKGSTIGS